MAEESVYLTRKGLEELKKELDYLIITKRTEVAAAIQQAKEFGDLAENAEYENAKNQQAFVEGRIATLEKMIASAVIIEDNRKGETIINVGSTVSIKNQHGKKQTFTIVGSAESDPMGGKISNSSPMGQALLGHQVKDKVKVPTPAGINEIEITSVN